MANYRVPIIDKFSWQPPVKSILGIEPGGPAKGDRYVVGVGATGANWGGGTHDNKITYFDGADWQYDTPAEGWQVWSEGANKFYYFDGSVWAETYTLGPTGPVSTTPGPTGASGAPSTVTGPTGISGEASTVPGPTGASGEASTVPGPTGASGEASTVPGPTGATGASGAPSTVPGPTGPTGPPAGYDSTYGCLIIPADAI
jgi:hypothetical protein